jgi:zinc protease
MSAGQKLKLIQQLIQTVSLEEVTAAFRRNFQPDARLLLVIMPEKEGLVAPKEEELLALAREVAGAEVAPPEEKVMRESLLEEEPAPGTITDREEEPELGVLSVTLSNGVRAHLRHMDFKENQVFIKLTVGGGVIQETAQNRGVTGLAAEVFDQPASSTLSSTEVQDLLTGKNVSLGGGAVEDALQVSLTSSTQDVESAFQLAHMVLTDPRLERSAVDRWKEQMLQAIEKRRMDVGDQAMEAMQELLSGGDARFQFPTEQQVQGLTGEQAQAWLDRLLREGPVEAAVVGDVDRERALELTLKYFGSLPERPFTDPSLEALRGLGYREGPLVATVEVPTITPRAVVLSGWRGADWTDVEDRRILQIVAEMLTSRLREEIREARGLTYSIWCIARPSRGYEGGGLFTVWFTADPDKALEAADLARGLVEEFAEEGPTDEELSAVRKQFKNSIETSQKEPTYWVSVLGELDYRGTVLSDVKEALEKYTSYTREEMLDVMSRYVVSKRRLQAVALPVPPEESEGGQETPSED